MIERRGLWEPLLRAPFFEQVERRIRDGKPGVRLSGLVEGSRALVLALLAARTERSMFLVVPDDSALESYRRDLTAFVSLSGGDPDGIVMLPALDADPYGAIPPHPEVTRERVVAMSRLIDDDFDVLLVSARALLNLVPSVDEWSRRVKTIRVDDSLPPERFVIEMLELGYRRVDTVSAPGEVSRRGGILDIFPMTADEPVRLELFGDDIESMRSFHPDNQRSTGKLDHVLIGPAGESPPTDEAVARVVDYLERGLASSSDEDDDRRVRHIRSLLDKLQNEGYWPGFESLAGLTAEHPTTLFDFIGDRLLVVDEQERTDDELLRADHDHRMAFEQSPETFLPPPARLFADPADVRTRLRHADVYLQELIGAHPGGDDIHVACRSARAYSGRVPELVEDLREAQARSLRIVCVMRAVGSADRLREIFKDESLPAVTYDDPSSSEAGGLFVGVGSLKSGFELQDVGLNVLSERGIFGEQRRGDRKKKKSRAAFISDFRDLKHGDYVVHVDHGVARYGGLGRPRGGSLNRDFMVLIFSAGDRLFVPVDRLDIVQKYNGVAGHKPSVDKLGGPGWERVKSRVRKSMQNMAKELLELYARREAATGHAFGEDTPWQHELEDAFPYELTPDQETTIAEIKRDMETPRPMDRLLVGDVGFGKTEMAVRATFKAMMDGKQVAVLTPTTVLAMQHFETFRRRFAPFPARVEMVSRFRSVADVKRTLQDAELGGVDVVIGTHRLLSKDVKFKNLGLLIVDEEQRFGVTHKERLKQLAVGVDVLAMTATPIPRTLQMSLAGVRDLSVIETPPPGRNAIQTYLVPWRQQVLAQAVRQELRRKGQVFVVHNNIETLPGVARAVQEMAPEARIVVAHGQLTERSLERAMLKFVSREADVLITTTIIENGLDIPAANTIIVNRADRFGLAQLYQLRGRVGRSREHAYAYFVIPSRTTLSEVAAKRLRALQEFSDLGAGFRLAAADLEIRGAGELLGARQHGHIGAIGFDLYCQMLERAVQELQGDEVQERMPTALNLAIDIKVPENYLPESADRLVLYKRLAQARSRGEVDQLEAETEDRFGHLPRPAQSLFAMGRLRLVAEQVGVKSVDLAERHLQIRFHEKPFVEPVRLVELVHRLGGSFTPSGMLMLPAPPRDGDRVEAVQDLLHEMVDASPTEVH